MSSAAERMGPLRLKYCAKCTDGTRRRSWEVTAAVDGLNIGDELLEYEGSDVYRYQRAPAAGASRSASDDDTGSGPLEQWRFNALFPDGAPPAFDDLFFEVLPFDQVAEKLLDRTGTIHTWVSIALKLCDEWLHEARHDAAESHELQSILGETHERLRVGPLDHLWTTGPEGQRQRAWLLKEPIAGVLSRYEPCEVPGGREHQLDVLRAGDVLHEHEGIGVYLQRQEWPSAKQLLARGELRRIIGKRPPSFSVTALRTAPVDVLDRAIAQAATLRRQIAEAVENAERLTGAGKADLEVWRAAA